MNIEKAHNPCAYPIYSGCTASRFAQLGINAVVNARGGEQWRNSITDEEWRQTRDARAVRARRTDRVRFYQFESRAFRNRPELRRYLSDRNE